MLGALSDTDASSFHRPPSHFFSRGSGEDDVKVPDVRGLRLPEAIRRLRAADFQVRVGPPVVSREYDGGTVAEMSPGPGPAESGRTIELRLSARR